MCMLAKHNFFYFQLGAESVNLTVQEKPADVYTDIAVR